jgi:multidrug resistance efflux pump
MSRDNAPPPAASEEKIHTSDDSTDEQAGAKKKSALAKKITLVLFALCGVFFFWYIASDRFTPYSDLARIDGYVVPIAPLVSGHLEAVNVARHALVKTGDVLCKIDTTQYDLALTKAESALQQAEQTMKAQVASIKSSASRVESAKAQLEIATRDFKRMQNITEANPGALSQADRDRTTANLANATANLASAEAQLERAVESLGVEGPENPMIKSAVTALEQAKLDLARTELRAPAAGLVENINLDVGYYAAAGQPLMSIISMRDVWIEAHLTENNLGNLRVGDRARFLLDVAPGKIFEGEVRSIGYGVTDKQGDQRGELPTVSERTGWMRDPQRFPVIIEFSDEAAVGLRRAGGQANVVIYTGTNPLLNSLANLRLRIVSWASYAR